MNYCLLALILPTAAAFAPATSTPVSTSLQDSLNGWVPDESKFAFGLPGSLDPKVRLGCYYCPHHYDRHTNLDYHTHIFAKRQYFSLFLTHRRNLTHLVLQMVPILCR